MSALPVIVGAGPVGLAAALFLSRRGVQTRIIDAAPAPSAFSRALAINPRTLTLLEESGVTPRLLDRGLKLHGACFRIGAGAPLNARFSDLPHRYPFMLALSQAVTERLLTEAVNERGIQVERGVALISCRQAPAAPVEIELESNGARSSHSCPWLLAADGAHSAVRQSLGLAFPGSSFADKWRLADVRLDTDLEPDRVHGSLLAGGGALIFIRVVEDFRREQSGPPLWRIITSGPDPLTAPIPGRIIGEPLWVSEFGVSHRCMREYASGSVYFAGDAAHIHSPIGARGMNLGIEDAWEFAARIASGSIADYSATRARIDRTVVRRIQILTRIVRARSLGARLARRIIFPLAARAKPLRMQILRSVTGLDHELTTRAF